MSATSIWQPAYSFAAAVGGVTPLFESCEVSEEVGTFDANNQLSGGHHEFGVDVTTRRIRGTYIIDTTDVRSVGIGTLMDASYSDGVSSISGKCRITRRSRTGASKGALKYTFEAVFTGPVVVS